MMNTTCYRLVVCEKPSVARSIAAVLKRAVHSSAGICGAQGKQLVLCHFPVPPYSQSPARRHRGLCNAHAQPRKRRL